MVIIRIPTTMQKFTQEKNTVEVSGNNVQTALEHLTSYYPELRPIIFTKNNQLQGYLNIFIDEINIREKECLQTEIDDEAELFLLPAVVGG